MRLYSAKVPKLSNEIVTAVTKDGDVETDLAERGAARRGSRTEPIRERRAGGLRARQDDDVASAACRRRSSAGIKKLVADERKIKIGDDAIDYILDQLVEMLMHSTNVEEIFAEDYVLRRKMREPLRTEAAQEQELQAEVRAQLRHVQEGTSMWEVEYRRMMDDLKRRKGL